jgi:hypothetical protein
VDGNSVFGRDVEIIGHDYVRYALLNLDVLHWEIERHLSDMPGQIESLKRQIAGEKDPKQRAMLEEQIAGIQSAIRELKEIKPTRPTMTYSSKLTLHRGQREIQLLFLGRGHTQGTPWCFFRKNGSCARGI